MQARCAGLAVAALALTRDRRRGRRVATASRTLRLGTSGTDVRALQRYLDRAGYDTTADGEFGPATRRSVRSFETAEERRANGTATRYEQRLVRTRAADAAAREPTRPRVPRHRGGVHRRERPGGRARLGARGGPGDHRGRQRDRHEAVQVRRRPRPLDRLGLRLLRLDLLRPARRRAARHAARLHRLHELGRARAGQVGHDLRQPGPRLHDRRGAALRHERPQAIGGNRWSERCALDAATASVIPEGL